MTSSPSWISYCANVHAGKDLESALSNLSSHGASIRGELNNQPLGVGLWFSEMAARECLHRFPGMALRQWLDDRGFEVRSLNGFPQGDFHQKVVKKKVYQPVWWEPSRLDYTLSLIEILSSCLPDGAVGTISTMPLGWRSPKPTEDQLLSAAKNLMEAARRLEQVFESTGKELVLAIEPEPGCILGNAASVRNFFQRYLLQGNASERNRRFLGICHDICHSAVMFEDQGLECQAYLDLGLRIAKVQVSSALEVRWDGLNSIETDEKLNQLKAFAEERYLHQTSVRKGPAGSIASYDDLSDAIRLESQVGQHDLWRIHFHLPIFLQSIGLFETTQRSIHEFLAWVRRSEDSGFTGQFEVETYAWSVLPATLAPNHLGSGIAKELQWLKELLG